MKESHMNEIWSQFIFDGNETALSKIYAGSYDLLYDYGKRITPIDQHIEDAIQDTFISIIKYRKNIGMIKNVNGYIISSFRRQLFLAIEKNKKNVYAEQLPVGYFDFFNNAEKEDPDRENTEILSETINECINGLTDKQKEILYLRFNSEISYEDIAHVLNISVESCYKSVYRTIKILRIKAEKMIVKRKNPFFDISLKENLSEKGRYYQKVTL